MVESIIIAGAGGQGVMLLGKVLAMAATRENKQVTWMPAYGPEVRGGTAHCTVVISDGEISSPWVDQANALIILNEPSFKRFAGRLKGQGLAIINSSLCSLAWSGKQVKALYLPFTDIAVSLGNIKIANMVALGCYLGQTKLVSMQSVIETMEEIAPPGAKNLVEINIRALARGRNLVEPHGLTAVGPLVFSGFRRGAKSRLCRPSGTAGWQGCGVK